MEGITKVKKNISKKVKKKMVKKWEICGSEITVEIEGSNWDVPLPIAYKKRTGLTFKSTLKKRYNKKWCLNCNDNQGRLIRKRLPLDSKSEYLASKYDSEHNEELKKIYEKKE